MDTEEVRSIIKGISMEFVSAVQAHNIAGITQLYTDKPRFMPRGGDIPQFGQVRTTAGPVSIYINTGAIFSR